MQTHFCCFAGASKALREQTSPFPNMYTSATVQKWNPIMCERQYQVAGNTNRIDIQCYTQLFQMKSHAHTPAQTAHHILNYCLCFKRTVNTDNLPNAVLCVSSSAITLLAPCWVNFFVGVLVGRLALSVIWTLLRVSIECSLRQNRISHSNKKGWGNCFVQCFMFLLLSCGNRFSAEYCTCKVDWSACVCVLVLK